MAGLAVESYINIIDKPEAVEKPVDREKVIFFSCINKYFTAYTFQFSFIALRSVALLTITALMQIVGSELGYVHMYLSASRAFRLAVLYYILTTY